MITINLKNRCSSKKSLALFMQTNITHLKELEQTRTGETYATAFNSFMRFTNGEDVSLSEMDSDMMVAYETYLKVNGVSMNTISFYMRILRAVYNRAVEQGITLQRYPFKHVYTGVCKTIKHALPLSVIKQIRLLELPPNSTLDYVRDMFLFSFYTRGMSFVDMAYLHKEDLSEGILSYKRKKTGQLLHIRWERCMENIVKKYSWNHTVYLLPILKDNGVDERRQYKNAITLMNRRLKDIGRMVGLTHPLTMHCARHSWASVAKHKRIPLSVISESMGHDSEGTTMIYLSSLDTAVIDEANKQVLKELF